ncbi:MAG: glycosyltransferase [Microlunatus sp.]
MLQRSLKLNPFPAQFRSAADPLIGPVINYRSASVLPDAGERDGGTVYVTLGTIFNTESGDLLARLSTASAAAAGVRSVIVATGEHLDPAGLGPQPEAVTAYRFVAQHEVLSTCSAVVCHGGSGTVLDAISHGLPLVLLPLGADQPLNAQRCSALGCGVVLPADTVGAEQITRAVDEVLTQPSYRAASARLRAGLMQLPGPDDVIRTLTRLWAA